MSRRPRLRRKPRPGHRSSEGGMCRSTPGRAEPGPRGVPGGRPPGINDETPPVSKPQGLRTGGAQSRVVRDRIELSTFRFSGGRSYRLSYLTSPGSRLTPGGRCPRPRGRGQACHRVPAVLTGFEPATSTLTGWRALLAALQDLLSPTRGDRAPNGIRTRAAALKGRCPRPLDDGGSGGQAAVTRGARRREPSQHRGGSRRQQSALVGPGQQAVCSAL
jgi:hypothetical protein